MKLFNLTASLRDDTFRRISQDSMACRQLSGHTAKLNHQSEKTNPKVFFFPLNDSKSDTLWNAIMQNTRRNSDEYKQLNSKTTLTSPGKCVMRKLNSGCIFALSFLLLRSQSQKICDEFVLFSDFSIYVW